MCSLFRHFDEQGSDSDIPATDAVTVVDEALPEGSTSRRQSLFVPQEGSEESDESSSLDNESQVQLNRFLQLRDVSPVRHKLSVPWNTAHERSKRRYLRKAQQCISAMLDVLAPENSQELWTELYAARVRLCSKAEVKKRLGFWTMNAFAESYLNAQHWSTRRQILSDGRQVIP